MEIEVNGMAGQHDDIETILQDCLEKIQSGQETLDGILEKYPHLADELRPALEAALWFRMRKATLDARPGFVNASRRRLVDRIQQEQSSQASQKKLPVWEGLTQFWRMLLGQRRLAFQIALVLLLVLAMVTGTSGVARAAQSSLPGELLYHFKTSLEKASIAVAVGDATKASLHIRYAQRRLIEIQSLVLENRDDLVAETELLFESHINAAIRHLVALQAQDPERALSLAVSLRSIIKDQIGTLRVLAATTSQPAREHIERILMFSGGVISLMDETIPSSGEAEVAIETPALGPTATRELVFATHTATLTVATQMPQPSPMISLTPVAQITSPVAGTSITDTATLTPTGTPVVSADEEEKKPTKTPKPTKTEKVKKPLPEPTRRPPLPTKDN